MKQSLPVNRSVNSSSLKRSATHPLDPCTYRSVAVLPVLKEPQVSALSSSSVCSVKRVKTWHVTDDSTPLLPPFPLERSKVAIDRKNATPTEIASRIAAALRTMSVDADFDSDKATACILTEDLIDIQISLFRNDNQETIVEVQRRAGCAIAFHHYARRILNAARGLHSTPSSSYKSVPSQVKRRIPLLSTKQDECKIAIQSLELADSHLQDSHMDVNRLGLESLCFLTDPKKTSIQTALLAGEAVLSQRPRHARGYSSSSTKEDGWSFFDSVLALILQGPNTDSLDRLDTTIAQAQEGQTLRRLALIAFANSLDVVIRHSHSTHLLEQAQSIDTHQLVSSLSQLLKHAEGSACDAYWAAKCLGLLLRVSTHAQKSCRELGIGMNVKRALDVGRVKHVKLEEEAEGLLRITV